MRAKHLRIVGLVIGLLVLMARVGSGAAQDQEMTEALDLSQQPIVLEFSTAGTGSPTIEPLADGRVVFKVNPEGTVSGDLEGTLSATVTELDLASKPDFDPISITFTIETDQGTLEGYYAGTFYLPTEDAEFADINGHGYILSVSGAYADLLLADVFVTSQVQMVGGMGVGESGTMTLTVR